MFGTMRKHQTWLWAVIITLVIISFLYAFSPASKTNSSARGSSDSEMINGEPISREDFARAAREVQLRYFFGSGGRFVDEEARRNGFDVERETYYWLVLLQEMKHMGIQVSDDAALTEARQMLGQFQRAGLTSVDVFVKQVLEPHELGIEDFERFTKHYVGIQELIATVGLSGKLVTPKEAESLYVREHEELSTAAVFFSASNYLASVVAPPDAVAHFYTNQLSAYRIPDRVQVSYVKWDLTNYQAGAREELAKLTNLDEQIDLAYQKDSSNFLKQVNAPTLDKARQKIHDARLKDFEVQAARKKANAFASALFEMEPQRPENLETLAKSNGLPVQVSEPFDDIDGPKDLNAGRAFVKDAFSLTASNEPYAGPVLGDDALFVIAYNKQIPSEVPPFEQIQGQVFEDYKNDRAMFLARSNGLAFYQKLTNGLAQGKTFSAICAENNLKPVELPPFSLSTRALPIVEDHGVSLNGERASHGQLGLKQLAFSTPPGKVSHFDPSNEGGMILYVRSRLPLDETKMKKELPSFVAVVRQQRQQEAFNVWFNEQLQKAHLPLGQQRAPGASPGPARS